MEERGGEAAFYGNALSNAFSALEKDGQLLGDPLHVERLWASGLAELYEFNKDAIIPLPRGDEALPIARKVYPLPEEGGGRNMKNGAFLAESESDSDCETDQKKSVEGATPQHENAGNEPGAKAGSAGDGSRANPFPQTEREKAAFSRARAAIAQLGECAEVSSLFLRSADLPQWWTKQSAKAAPSELDRDSLSLEIGATAQCMAVAAARKAVAELTKGVPEADLSNLRLAPTHAEGEFVVADEKRSEAAAVDGVCSEVLNKALPEMTVSPQAHVLDLMPALRGMARTEEMRRAGRGEGKRSRSGRFLHYFEGRDIYLQPATVIEMCNAFL